MTVTEARDSSIQRQVPLDPQVTSRGLPRCRSSLRGRRTCVMWSRPAWSRNASLYRQRRHPVGLVQIHRLDGLRIRPPVEQPGLRRSGSAARPPGRSRGTSTRFRRRSRRRSGSSPPTRRSIEQTVTSSPNGAKVLRTCSGFVNTSKTSCDRSIEVSGDGRSRDRWGTR